MDFIPLEWIFILTVLLLYGALEVGYRIGNMYSEEEKKLREKISSSNAGSVLSILAFLLVFTFGIVYNRYDLRKELLRNEANMIKTAVLRSDFLPEQERAETSKFFSNYIDLRISSDAGSSELVQNVIDESNVIQKKLWKIAVENARKEMNSEMDALYIESLNEMFNQQALRIAVGLQARVPLALWLMLYLAVILGMFCVGYEAAISRSFKRSWLTPIMVLTFTLMIFLIASLDRPDSNIMQVSHQPLIDLKQWINK